MPKAATPARPEGPRLPEKFLDPETGDLRVEALLASYRELERKLARMVEVPGAEAEASARQRFHRALGVPERPEDYAPTLSDARLEPDLEVNRRLHAAGFTPEQVQLVYDLAVERMVPAVEEMAAEFESDRQLQRLVEHFGGPEQWREIAASIKAWGAKSLPPEVFAALATTFEGIVAMHRMMEGGEPGILRDGAEGATEGETELRRLMADPRYWRERDPAVIRRVTQGFERLYPAKG